MVRISNGRLVEISEPENLTVVGDIHGDLQSFNDILNRRKKGGNNYTIFLGDYADRGENGMEIIEKLAEMKHDNDVVLLKGNHEDYYTDGEPHFNPCTLRGEVQSKRGHWDSYFKEKLKPFFDSLYTSAIVNNSILLVHGGISSRIKSLDDLRNPAYVEEDILWSDPGDSDGEQANMRGAGVEFGEDITKKVLDAIKADMIIRSHQPNLARNGPDITQERVVTISSTNVYGGRPHYLEIPGSKIKEVAISPLEIKKYTRFI